jgi:hypothetical protein
MFTLLDTLAVILLECTLKMRRARNELQPCNDSSGSLLLLENH